MLRLLLPRQAARLQAQVLLRMLRPHPRLRQGRPSLERLLAPAAAAAEKGCMLREHQRLRLQHVARLHDPACAVRQARHAPPHERQATTLVSN